MRPCSLALWTLRQRGSPVLTLWDRTKGKQNVKAIASLGSMPNYLLSNNPAVKSIKDLSAKDRIAVPAAGVGFQSRTLQIETAKLYGDGTSNASIN
jgi:NitT/TauT family transport system substrate-binding protein